MFLFFAERQSPATRCGRRALIARLNVVVFIQISSPERQRIGSADLFGLFATGGLFNILQFLEAIWPDHFKYPFILVLGIRL